MSDRPEPAATAHFLSLKPGQMAKAMGVSYSTYKKWASGTNKLPPLAQQILIYMRAESSGADLARHIAGVEAG